MKSNKIIIKMEAVIGIIPPHYKRNLRERGKIRGSCQNSVGRIWISFKRNGLM